MTDRTPMCLAMVIAFACIVHLLHTSELQSLLTVPFRLSKRCGTVSSVYCCASLHVILFIQCVQARLYATHSSYEGERFSEDKCSRIPGCGKCIGTFKEESGSVLSLYRITIVYFFIARRWDALVSWRKCRTSDSIIWTGLQQNHVDAIHKRWKFRARSVHRALKRECWRDDTFMRCYVRRAHKQATHCSFNARLNSRFFVMVNTTSPMMIVVAGTIITQMPIVSAPVIGRFFF